MTKEFSETSTFIKIQKEEDFLGENPSLLNIKWREYFPEIFIRSLEFERLLKEIETSIESSNPALSKILSLRENFENLWNREKKVYETILTLEKKERDLLKAINNLSSLREALLKKSEIEKNKRLLELKRIEEEKRTLSNEIEKVRVEIEESKKKRENLKQKYEKLKEEIETIEKKKKELNERKKELRKKQSKNYSDTNKLTDKIDELEKRIQVYREKLEILDPTADQEQYERIKGKMENLKKEQDGIKEMRRTLMKESQAIKKELISGKKEEKKLIQHHKLKIKEFAPIEKDYKVQTQKLETLIAQYERIEDKIAELEEQGSELRANESILESEKITKDPSIHHDDLDRVLEETMENYVKTYRQLEKEFRSQVPDEILSKISKRQDEVREDLETVRNEKELLKNQLEKEWSNIVSYLRFLEEFHWYYNRLLSLGETKIQSVLQYICDENGNLHLSFKHFKQGQEIKHPEELKRKEMIILIILFIIAFHFIIGNYDVVIGNNVFDVSKEDKKTVNEIIKILNTIMKKARSANIILNKLYFLSK